MPPPIATLDTNVLFPSQLRDTLLDLSDAGLYLCRWSAETLNEVNRNLAKRSGVGPDGARRLIAALRAAFPSATVLNSFDPGSAAVLLVHPKDRHVLAAAVAPVPPCW